MTCKPLVNIFRRSDVVNSWSLYFFHFVPNKQSAYLQIIFEQENVSLPEIQFLTICLTPLLHVTKPNNKLTLGVGPTFSHHLHICTAAPILRPPTSYTPTTWEDSTLDLPTTHRPTKDRHRCSLDHSGAAAVSELSQSIKVSTRTHIGKADFALR